MYNIFSKFLKLKSLKKISLFFVLILFISSCNYFSKYEGFKKTRTDIYYKLIKFGESSDKAQPGDYITADISYKTISDSIFFKGRRKLQISEPKYPGAIDECFLMLAENEKAVFIISSYDFFKKTVETSQPQFLNIEDNMKVTIDIIDIQTEKEFIQEKEAFLSWIEDFGDYEKVLLKQFIEQRKIDSSPTNSGLYHIVIDKGNNKIVELGDTVTVEYEGKFLNGKFFDSTKRRNQPFQFVYGKKWQVVEGLEEAIGRMREKEHALFIIPSELAFGEIGSSTGIIPPYTSTIFDVELLEIKKGTKINKGELNKYD
ncbi:MAG: FKBP-type peptidyl-prolyl cis-trans isomerase [Bacteroidales bacterium]|jgi:FKBP-type peptidyl-prolyl cis-trans isomerase FkpA|nr:FKBP-type peptidyl-prolyl cis-trans isomerase [Bacteroidales bacterium]